MCKLVKRPVREGFLWADANGGYDLATALAVAPKLADAGVAVLESPLRPNRTSGDRALKKQGALPILMDESVVAPEVLIEFIQLDMMDGVAMKPARCGGLWPQRRQIEIIEDAGLIWLRSFQRSAVFANHRKTKTGALKRWRALASFSLEGSKSGRSDEQDD